MHASMMTTGEEVADAREVFIDLGVLIVEGRVPGGQYATGRGYGEGPHCPKPTPTAAATGPRHDCDNSFMCKRAENLRKHVQLLWENKVPLCIEVLLCAECVCGKQKALCSDATSVPTPEDMLLEQWLVAVTPIDNRNNDGSPPMTVRGLFQAVRSQLHFSQLSAWWSSSKGANPIHVTYRVTVPEEAFTSQFRQPPSVHTFPVANITASTRVKVSVRTAPRMEHVPQVACSLHPLSPIPSAAASPPQRRATRRRELSFTPSSGMVDDRMQNPCTQPGKHHCHCAYEEDFEPPASLEQKPSATESSSQCVRPECGAVKAGTVLEKQAKRVRKEDGCDNSPTSSGAKLNLELSRREFEEVLSVLRDRNGPTVHQGSKSSMPCCESKTNRLPGLKPCDREGCSVYNLQTPTPPLKPPPSLGKGELLLEAILRANDHNDKHKPLDDVSVLSRQLSKITLGMEEKRCRERVGVSGTKRKRLDGKSTFGDDRVDDCDSVSNKKLVDPVSIFKDKFRSERFKKIMSSHKEENQDKFESLSSTIDERPLASGPRIIKQTKRKCDVIGEEKVPCDAVDSKIVVSNQSPLAVIKEGPRTTERDDPTVPSASEKATFRRNLDTAASLVFHSRTGLPLTSSPAPVRRNATCFDFDSSINSVSAIRTALFDSAVNTPTQLEDSLSFSSDDAESEAGRSPCSPRISFPPARCCWSRCTHLASSLLGTFEESVLNGRLEPVSTVQGFTANLGASGSFCPRHVTLPVTVFFYTLGDNDKVSTPYLAHINLGKRGYNVPRSGTIQVTLLNPLGTVVKMFVVMYDLSDMPANSHTFLRQRTLYMPAKADSHCQPDNFQKWLRYLIHLRFSSSKSGRLFLHTDIRMIIFRKSDLDTATAHGIEDTSYELRSFTQGPTNPKFSSRK